MAKSCGICGRKLNFLSTSVDIKPGTICHYCFGAISDYRWKKDGESMVPLLLDDSYTFEDGKRELAEIKLAPQMLQKTVNDFCATATFDTVHFNDNTNSLLIEISDVKSEVFQYDQIISFDLIENGNNVISGGTGSAITGGLLFGEVGAVVGSVTATRKTAELCTLLKIKITFRNCQRQSIDITFIEDKNGLPKNSFEYRTKYKLAEGMITALQVAVDKVKQSETLPKTSVISAADEILKFKSLLDAGIITEEEFQAKKKQLLGI